MSTHHLFAPCPRGLEAALAAELSEFGAQTTEVADGGVAFTGTERLMYRANLESRLASRILLRVGRCAYRSEDDIYRGARSLPWPSMFGRNQSIRVAVNAVNAPVRSLDFVTLRVKDAVCDAFRAQTGERPNVDTRAPDVRIQVFLDAKQASFYLDTSGEPLFKRGWRTGDIDAPLRENLAAGILRLAGWMPGIPLLDPMCGGGTFLLEAAAASLNIAPGACRGFGFERLIRFDPGLWASVRDAAEASRQPNTLLPIFGSDREPRAISASRRALSRAGLNEVAHLACTDVLELEAPAPAGIMVLNPPYGVRIGEHAQLAELYPRLGDRLKRSFCGWRCFIFTADMRLPRLIGLKPTRRIPLYNGALECRLYEFAIVAGSMRGRRLREDGELPG